MAEGRPMPPAGGTVEHLVQCEELRETVGSAVREVVEAQQTPGASDGAAAAPVVLVPDQFEGVDACPAVTGPPLASLIIPAHNEETRLLPTLSKYADLLEERLGEAFEIIVVVNGCRDQTAAVAVIAAAMRPQIVVVVVDAAIGKGGAVLEGFRHARGDKVLFADADGATGAESLVQLVAALDEFDVAIGSRRMAGSQLLRAQPLNRRLLGLAFATVVRECCGLRFTDTQCGAKALRGPIAKQLCEAVTELRWTFDVDLLVQALAMGASISERPVEWTDQPGSKLSVLPTLLEVLPSLRRIRVKSAAQRLTASVPFGGMPAVAAGEPALAAA